MVGSEGHGILIGSLGRGFQHLKLKPCILNSHATTHCTLPQSCPLYSTLSCSATFFTVLFCKIAKPSIG